MTGLARWIRRAAILGVAVSVVGLGARTFWHLMGETAIGGAAVVVPAPADAPPEVDLDPVLAFAPFGTTAAPPTPAKAPPLAPEVELQLFGVMMGPTSDTSRALIGHEGKTQSYRIGDTVANAAVLTEVRDTSVVLDIGGTPRVLDFESFRTADGEKDATGSDPLDRLSSAIVRTPRAPLVPEPRDSRPETAEDLIAFWRDRISKNPRQVLDAVGFVQVDNGYEVAAQHDRGVALAGLLEGDVIKSVNGRTIGNVVADRNLFDDVMASGAARVEIEREGRVISMSFPIP